MYQMHEVQDRERRGWEGGRERGGRGTREGREREEMLGNGAFPLRTGTLAVSMDLSEREFMNFVREMLFPILLRYLPSRGTDVGGKA